MSRVKDTTDGDPAATADQIRQTLTGRHVCPYCGHQNAGGPDPCPRCTMEDTPATRQATKARIGPWYVLQSRNPAAPGMRYSTILALINKGQITPRSILRGPTTHQLWRFAAHVRSISREFGLCYSCGGAVERTSNICPNCQRSQEAPAEPDKLLESRPSNGQPPSAPADAVADAPSYAARIREINRPRSPNEFQDAPAVVNRVELPRRAGSRVVSAMSLATALQDDPRGIEIDSPKRSTFKIAMLLLVLVVGIAAGVFYFQPGYRDPALSWLTDTWSTVKTKFTSIKWPKSTIAPVANAAAVESKPPTERLLPYSAPIDEPPRPTAEISIKPPPAPAVTPAPPKPVDLSAAIDEERQLWSQAIDAEARQDYTTEVKLLQQISALPRSAWPDGLQVRLDWAQKSIDSTASK